MSVALARRADRALVTVPAALDGWPDPPANVVHVGPIAEEAVPLPWVPPWADGEAIASPALRDGARRMAGVLAACGGASAAADEIEEVAAVVRSGSLLCAERHPSG
jgi:hypothetical protein